MLSGLSSLLFGSGGTDDAAVDQTLASPPTPLDTQDTDNGWVLVDVADERNSQPGPPQSLEEPDNHVEPTTPEREMEHEEQRENQPQGPVENAVQPRHPQHAPRVVRADTLEMEKVKLTRSTQRLQQVARSKQLSKRHLDTGNKARLVQSCGRKSASARSRVLRPSGRMNGRQSQRQF